MADRLRKKLERAGLHRLDAHVHVGVAADEDGVASDHRALGRNGAGDSLHSARELDQRAVAGGLDNAPLVSVSNGSKSFFGAS